MDLQYETDRGWPTNIAARLRRRVGALARNERSFKIGITNWPEQRIRWYRRNYDKEFDEMIVLYETRSQANAAILERDLVDYNWYHRGIWNERAGGAGRQGAGWYFLYIVR